MSSNTKNNDNEEYLAGLFWIFQFYRHGKQDQSLTCKTEKAFKHEGYFAINDELISISYFYYFLCMISQHKHMY